jgi:hypothetical protein
MSSLRSQSSTARGSRSSTVIAHVVGPHASDRRLLQRISLRSQEEEGPMTVEEKVGVATRSGGRTIGSK